MSTEIDISPTIVAKSDQLNADDLMGGARIITVTDVAVREGAREQPVSVYYEGDDNKPWKPCKSMLRVLAKAWGVDGNVWVGRQIELYREDAVKWAGEEVGGIRIRALSHINKPLELPLTVTRGKKQKTRIEVLQVASVRAKAPMESISSEDAMKMADALELCGEAYAAKVLGWAGVSRVEDFPAGKFATAMKRIQEHLDKEEGGQHE